MRTQLYTALIDKLKEYTGSDGTPIFRHFDLWNRQVDFLEDEAPFDLPAIFIEFPHIEWKSPMQGVQRAEIPVVLHVATEYKGSESDGSIYQSAALERLNIVDGLARHLFNWRYSDASFAVHQTCRTASDTNHDHAEIIEDIEQFSCVVTHNYK